VHEVYIFDVEIFVATVADGVLLSSPIEILIGPTDVFVVDVLNGHGSSSGVLCFVDRIVIRRRKLSATETLADEDFVDGETTRVVARLLHGEPID
jgi:hypothetical protein